MGVFDDIQVYTTYEVELHMKDKLMGGVPKDPKVIQGWLKAKAGITEEHEMHRMMLRTLHENGDLNGTTATALLEIEQDPAAMMELLDEASERLASVAQTSGFKFDENGLYISAYQIKAMLKENTNILFAGERWGKTKKGPLGFVTERAFVAPQRIHLGVMEADGVEQSQGHVTDQRGNKRSFLSLHEYVERPVIRFQVEMLKDQLTRQQWGEIWQSASRNGLGAQRSKEEGQFTIERWERV